MDYQDVCKTLGVGRLTLSSTDYACRAVVSRAMGQMERAEAFFRAAALTTGSAFRAEELLAQADSIAKGGR